MDFNELQLNTQLLEAIGYMGFQRATPIQEKAIPIIMKGKDIIACAQTGTGKTAAFILPVLNYLAEHAGEKGTRVLIIVPTRELALQIDQQIQGFSYFLGIHSLAVYGGGSAGDFDVQRKGLSRGSEIIVATPGKLISHLNMGYAKFHDLKFLILDEADRMLDMGFGEDILQIISHLPKKRQTLMFSATLPHRIRQLANELLQEPEEVSLALSKPAEGVLQVAYLVREEQKIALVKRLIADKPNYQRILIFCSTKKKVLDLSTVLQKSKLNVHPISSDLEQSDREQVLNKFKGKQIRILIATDVLSRGIDIKDINLIINFDVPRNAEDYVHRVGRTARADTTGVAITLVNRDDMGNFHQIERLIDWEVMKLKLPPEIGESPEWNPGRRKGSGNKFKKGKGGGKRKFDGRKGDKKKKWREKK